MSTQETTEEEQAEEETEETSEEEKTSEEAEASGKPEEAAQPDDPEKARLDEVTERIDKARAQAEDAGVLVEEDEETFVESGDTEPEDDQTIAPPG